MDAIIQQRLTKLERIRARGVNPYPHSFARSHRIAEAKALFEKQEKGGEAPGEMNLAGRILAMRGMGKASFFDINDGSAKVQFFFRKDNIGPERYEQLQELDLGDIIGARGRLVRTRTGEITLEVADYQILAKSLQPLPEKWHGLTDTDIRYRKRYIDLIVNDEVRQTFVTRSKVVAAVRRFLDERGFIEVETPVFQPLAGGARARPFVAHYQALGEDLYLRIALELHLKRLIVGGLDRVYEIGRVFRNEGIDAEHNPEFTMLEAYQAYADYNDTMKLTEDMLAFTAKTALGTNVSQRHGHTIDFTPPYKRVDFREALKQFGGIDFEEYRDLAALQGRAEQSGLKVDPAKDWGRLVDELFSTYVQPNLITPTFVLDYPLEMSPLAKRKRDNPKLVERFELYADGMEVANSFTELNDPIDQRERFGDQAKCRPREEECEVVDEDFLNALEVGMPPTGGLGVGIDRLVMLLTDRHSIREVVLFPQLKSKE